MTPARRHTLAKRLKLAGLAFLGLCAVSIPVTVAIVFSATGTSDLLTIGGASPGHRHATAERQVSRLRCTATRGYYALTFEDGPNAGSTPDLVAVLKRARAVATFFDVGEKAAALPLLVELQRSVGQVANHSYTHARLTRVSHERRLQELRATARALDYPNALFRPPYGETNAAVDADLRLSGLTAVYWTIDTHDALRPPVDDIVARALAVAPGGIVRLHDGVAPTLEAVPRIVAALRRRGMCPGVLAPASASVAGPGGIRFQVTAVKP